MKGLVRFVLFVLSVWVIYRYRFRLFHMLLSIDFVCRMVSIPSLRKRLHLIG